MIYSHECDPPLFATHVRRDAGHGDPDEDDRRSNSDRSDEPHQEADDTKQTDEHLKQRRHRETTLQLKQRKGSSGDKLNILIY